MTNVWQFNETPPTHRSEEKPASSTDSHQILTTTPVWQVPGQVETFKYETGATAWQRRRAARRHNTLSNGPCLNNTTNNTSPYSPPPPSRGPYKHSPMPDRWSLMDGWSPVFVCRVEPGSVHIALNSYSSLWPLVPGLISFRETSASRPLSPPPPFCLCTHVFPSSSKSGR